jgi:hypothetical protein
MVLKEDEEFQIEVMVEMMESLPRVLALISFLEALSVTQDYKLTRAVHTRREFENCCRQVPSFLEDFKTQVLELLLPPLKRKE